MHDQCSEKPRGKNQENQRNKRLRQATQFVPAGVDN
jgi:hypothetical protein